jgi:hypothetical protein
MAHDPTLTQPDLYLKLLRTEGVSFLVTIFTPSFLFYFGGVLFGITAAPENLVELLEQVIRRFRKSWSWSYKSLDNS